MKKVPVALFIAGLPGSLLGTPGIVATPAVLFMAMDLDDALGPGGDLWQYSYAVSGFPFPKDCRYSLSCACGLHSNRENPPAVVDADWDDLIIQPAPSSPRCGSLRCPGSGAGAGDPEWLVKPGA